MELCLRLLLPVEQEVLELCADSRPATEPLLLREAQPLTLGELLLLLLREAEGESLALLLRLEL